MRNLDQRDRFTHLELTVTGKLIWRGRFGRGATSWRRELKETGRSAELSSSFDGPPNLKNHRFVATIS